MEDRREKANAILDALNYATAENVMTESPKTDKRCINLSEQSDYSARVLINDTLQKDFEKRIEQMFNAIIRGHKWNWEKGDFDPYMYCNHKEKQFCGMSNKKFSLNIENMYVKGDSLIDCKLQVINWFLHGKPFFPFIK